MTLFEKYDKVKEKYPKHIVLMRIGDFFEAFDEDARTVSQVCDIVLASRPAGSERRQMAGFPYFAAEKYLAKLIAAGHKVGLVEKAGGGPVELREPKR